MFGADTLHNEKDGAVWLNTSKILGEKLLAAGKKPEDIEKLGLKVVIGVPLT